MPAHLQTAHPMLAVPDVTAAAEWYRDRLGFRVHGLYGDPAFYALVERDDVWLNFIASESASGEPGERGGAYLHVDDVDALYDEIKDRTVTFFSPPEDRDYGMRDFIALDLNGYRLCFGTPLRHE